MNALKAYMLTQVQKYLQNVCEYIYVCMHSVCACVCVSI